MPLRHALLAVFVTVIWGLNFVVISVGVAQVPPILFAAIRFTLLLVPAIFLVKRPDVSWRLLGAIGLMMTVGHFGLLYLALALGMPTGLASLVLMVQVVFTVIVAALGLKERPNPVQVAGVAVGVIGLVIVAVGIDANTPVLAFLLTLASAMAWAIATVLTRKAASGSGLGLTVWSSLFAPLPLFALSLAVEGPEAIAVGLGNFGLSAALSTAYTTYLSSLLGYGIWNTLLGKYPAHSVVPFVLLVPVFGMTSAWLLQGEVPGIHDLVGGGFLLLGVAITSGLFTHRHRGRRRERIRLDDHAAERTGV